MSFMRFSIDHQFKVAVNGNQKSEFLVSLKNNDLFLSVSVDDDFTSSFEINYPNGIDGLFSIESLDDCTWLIKTAGVFSVPDYFGIRSTLLRKRADPLLFLDYVGDSSGNIFKCHMEMSQNVVIGKLIC